MSLGTGFTTGATKPRPMWLPITPGKTPGTNSPHARSAHIARTPPVTLPITLASSPVTLAPLTDSTESTTKYWIYRYKIYRSHKSFEESNTNTESIDTKFIDPTNHLQDRYNPYGVNS